MTVVSVTSPNSNTRIYMNSDSSTFIKTEGSLAWENNNPGNLKYSTFAAAQAAGAIGVDPNGFAIFPTYQTGETALTNVVSSTYASDTLNQTIQAYAPQNENDTAGYQSFVSTKVGVSGNTVISTLTQLQLASLINAIMSIEGTQPGVVTSPGQISGSYDLNSQNPTSVFPYGGATTPGSFTLPLSSDFNSSETDPIVLDLSSSGKH